NARRRFGSMPSPAVQSRFIYELPQELVMSDIIDSDLKVEKSFRYSFVPSISKSQQDEVFSVGDHVEHKLFGKGKVLAVEGTGGNAKLTIVFSGNVRKKIIAKYANLTQYQTR
ncbi:uncharacterized protein METZ01_LOCUS374476, partial [marine metagenome]